MDAKARYDELVDDLIEEAVNAAEASVGGSTVEGEFREV